MLISSRRPKVSNFFVGGAPRHLQSFAYLKRRKRAPAVVSFLDLGYPNFFRPSALVDDLTNSKNSLYNLLYFDSFNVVAPCAAKSAAN